MPEPVGGDREEVVTGTRADHPPTLRFRGDLVALRDGVPLVSQLRNQAATPSLPAGS